MLEGEIFYKPVFLVCSTPMPSLVKILEHGLTAHQIKHRSTHMTDGRMAF